MKQIKAWAKINIINEEGKKGFDAFLILNNKGEGRIEALGPWKSPVFSIVFNPDFVYLYVFNESTLYYGSNKPGYLQKLTEVPLDLSLLFDSLVSNLPESISQCSGFFSEVEDYSCLHMDCEEQDEGFRARIMIRDFPVIEEVAWIGEKKYENFLVKYFYSGIQNEFVLPRTVHFQWPKGKELHISFISLKVNQPVSDETFRADEIWFQGKVINLEGLDILER